MKKRQRTLQAPPLPDDIEVTIPGWVIKIPDDCTRAVAKTTFATKGMASKAGAERPGRCKSYFTQGVDYLPSKAELLTSHKTAENCERLAKAERLFAMAEHCAERKRK